LLGHVLYRFELTLNLFPQSRQQVLSVNRCVSAMFNCSNGRVTLHWVVRPFVLGLICIS